jgi:hypothetical protein
MDIDTIEDYEKVKNMDVINRGHWKTIFFDQFPINANINSLELQHFSTVTFIQLIECWTFSVT